jgi:MFS family permease
MTDTRQWPVVSLLGCTQTLSWASTFYLPALLAVPMARDLGESVPMVFAAFSVALVVSAGLGPYAGRSIDRFGGRPVLAATNAVFAVGLALLAQVQGPWGLFGAWLVLGVGMGSGLYEAAFAALVRLYGAQARNAITGITLIAGFASTVGWPLTTWLEHIWGWRGACLGWAALHIVLGLPLNLLLPAALAAPGAPVPASRSPDGDPQVSALHSMPPRATAALLAIVFAVTAFVSTAMAAHLPRLLQISGTTLGAAVAAGALVGPAQVVARLLEFGVLRRMHPLLSARLAAVMHPAGAVALALFGAPAVALFAVLHGAGNGMLTIAKGTLPLSLFGPQGYGARQGLLMLPARVAAAASPWVFGLCLDRFGSGAVVVSGALGAVAFVALLALQTPEAVAVGARPP